MKAFKLQMYLLIKYSNQFSKMMPSRISWETTWSFYVNRRRKSPLRSFSHGVL